MEEEAGREKVVRDPLWSTVTLDQTALRIVDAPGFQRLRRVRQLGFAYLVYPGATHTRFDHALGVYELTRRALALLGERGELKTVDPFEPRLVPYAALLHDIGHYPFSHALEELPGARVPGHHEQLAGRFLSEGEIGDALRTLHPEAPELVAAMIRGGSDSSLRGLVAGSLDLDKIEYLKRDAFFCGVPYGAVDVDRLLHSLAVVADPETGRREVGIREKGLSALESLLFSKYQMFRNVYWHHAVRSATCVYKRMVREAIDAGAVRPDELVGLSDDELTSLLAARRRMGGIWLPALLNRRLPKRALEISGDALRAAPLEAWIYDDARLLERLEARLAGELSLPAGTLFLDYPRKPEMMGLDLLLRGRDDSVQRLGAGGRAGLIDLPRVADELYHSARVLRVFTVERRRIDPKPVLEILKLPPPQLEARLDQSSPLLS
ncbi:MAG: HD domain-containing protein [Longimicrobiaceae bacterium]